MGVCLTHYIIPRDNTMRPEPDRIVALIEAWLEAGFIARPGSAALQCLSPHLSAETGATFVIDDWWLQVLEQDKSREPRRTWSQWLAGAPKQAPYILVDLRRAFSMPPVGDSLVALASPSASIAWPINNYPSMGTVYPFETLPDPADNDDYGPSYCLKIDLTDDFKNEFTDNYGGADGFCKQLDTHCNCGFDLIYTRTLQFEEKRIHRSCPECGLPFRPQDRPVEIRDGETGEKHVVPGGVCYRFAIIVDCGKDFPPPEGRNPRASTRFLETCSKALDLELYEISLYS